MKKVMLLVLTVMLVSAFLMASGPSLRVVKLTVINKSGNDVMIRLEGSDIGKQFYYLTIPAGNKSWPHVEVFTVLEDVYKRTTWYGEGDNPLCVGLESKGALVMDRNNRLVFTPCSSMPPNAGEPSQEKVVYYESTSVYYLSLAKGGWISWENIDSGDIAANRCGKIWVGWTTNKTKVPNLCMWRYTYSYPD